MSKAHSIVAKNVELAKWPNQYQTQIWDTTR